MQDQFKLLKPFSNLDRFGEDAMYNQKLYAVNIFPYSTLLSQGRVNRAVLNFSFRDIDFNKKRALPFFFALENVVQNHLFHLVFWRWENVNIFWVFYCPPFSLFLKTFEFW